MNSTLKSLVFWMVLIAVAVLVWNFSSKFQRNESATTFSEFISMVDAGQVTRVTITGNEITGVSKSNENFKTYAPSQYSACQPPDRSQRHRDGKRGSRFMFLLWHHRIG